MAAAATPLSFAEATIMRVRAKEEADVFMKACAERESEMADELNGIVGIFKNVLASGTGAVQTADGSYLYVKTNVSTRALNEERLGVAVDNITLSQLKRAETALKDSGDVTMVHILCACVEENLEDECTRVSHAPTVSKRRPAALDPSVVAQPASDAVERAVEKFLRLKKTLAELRRHRSLGRRRVADVANETEPAIRTYMDEKNVAKQRVRLVNQPVVQARPPEPTLPAVPAFLPAHAAEDERRLSEANGEPLRKRAKPDAPPVTMTASQLAPRTVEFKTRTYTSRGKAPRMREFTEILPTVVHQVVGAEATAPSESLLKKWATKESKKKLLASLLDRYTVLFNASKGKTTEKLVVRTV